MKNQSAIKTITTAIEEKAVLLQSFFNSVQQYQVLLNKRFEIVAFNDSALNYHHTYAQLHLEKGRNILDYINTSLAADFKTQCETALNGEPVQYEHFINGGWFNFVMGALSDFDGKIAGLFIVGNNIDNQKKTAKIIRQQSECLSTIAQFQSHQVRHPVSTILGFMNLIKEEEDYNLKQEYLLALETATKQLDEITRAIVNQSRDM